MRKAVDRKGIKEPISLFFPNSMTLSGIYTPTVLLVRIGISVRQRLALRKPLRASMGEKI